jgi:hypothetical protein
MTTPGTPGSEPFDDLAFAIAYAISRSMIIPKSYRKLVVSEPLAHEILDHLKRCNYLITKGPKIKPHGTFMPEKSKK